MNISEMLAEQLERFFTDTVDRNLLVQVEQGTAATDLWQELEGLGICSALVSEAAGGAGLSWTDAEASLRTIGRHGAPAPIAETMLANWVLSQASLTVPEGPIAVSTELFTLNADGTLNGSDSSVAWLPSCQHLVLIALRNGQAHVCRLGQDNYPTAQQETLSREPHSALNLNSAKVLESAPIEGLGTNGLKPYLACIRAIQISGALEQLLELSVEYGNTREQFGRPIGKFQAIQHSIANLASQTAAAQVAGMYACRQIDAGNAEKGAMVAKVRAGQSAGVGAEIAHQVFGAIGFTDEHILHYFTRRLWQWRTEAGSEYWWAEQLGKEVISAGGEALWPSITSQ
ncbi:MAG: acyl-CoA dehydrogenase [Spongiibacteraceae bacterium]